MKVLREGSANPDVQCRCGAVVRLEKDDIICRYAFGVATSHKYGLPPPPQYGYICPCCHNFRMASISSEWRAYAFSKGQAAYRKAEQEQATANPFTGCRPWNMGWLKKLLGIKEKT